MNVQTEGALGTNVDRRVFPCFDGLRALAALSVFTYHSAQWVRQRNPDIFNPGLFNWLDRLGFFGVAVFFVISGFLLYRPYASAAADGRPPPRLGTFWLRRAARIYPGYWLVLAFVVIVGQFSLFSVGQTLSIATLTQSYRQGYGAGIVVAWSLVIEVSFYVVLPGIAWVLRRLGGFRGQMLGLAGLAAIGVVSRAWWLSLDLAAPAAGAWFPVAQFHLFLPAWLDWFALGMVMAVVSVRGIRVAIPPWVAWAAALAFYWAVVLLEFPPGLAFIKYDPTDSFLRWIFTGLAGACFVLPAVFGEGGLIRQFLNARVLVALGIISYGIYLWHLQLWVEASSWSWFPSSPTLQVAVVFLLTIAAATLSYWLVERPATRWARRISRG